MWHRKSEISHKVNIFGVLLLSVFTLTGCASLEQQRTNIEQDIYAIYSELYEDEILQFFVDEAVEADVRKIRRMKPSDVLPPVNEFQIVGCAYTFKYSKTVLIEVEEPLCVKLSHLAHEISHIGSNCSGHNDVFYKYNFEVARRYQERFPNAAKRRWFAPVQDVASVAAIYRSEGCQSIHQCHITSTCRRIAKRLRLMLTADVSVMCLNRKIIVEL